MTSPLPRTVLVTGASGFLGRHVSDALIARGVKVRGLVRRPDARVAQGTELIVAADLEEAAVVRAAARGMEGVVHLAARVHQDSEDDAESRRVNVDGTRLLLQAALAAGAGVFAFISSVKAVGEATDGDERWTEAKAPAPRDAYGRTKLEAEQVVREMAARAGTRAPILRLPLVYGPGMKANALRLFDLVARGTPLPFGAIRNRRSLLFTGNFSAALLAVLKSPQAGDTFFVSDNEDVSTPALAAAIGRALDRPARLLPVPVPVLRLAGRLGDLGGRRAPLTTAAVDRLISSLAVDPAELMRQTGYSPPVTLTEGLRITAEWYRREHAAP